MDSVELHNQLRETAKPHPQYERTDTFLLGLLLNHCSADGDTPRVRSLTNKSWFILSKAFDMSINTNIEILFSSMAFNRSSVTDRGAVSAEWYLSFN